MRLKFQTGDFVRWNYKLRGKSQSQEGRILHIVPAGAHPLSFVSASCLSNKIRLKNPRNHESYLILTTGEDHYNWPAVYKLTDCDSPIQLAVEEAALRCADLATNGSRDATKFKIIILEELRAEQIL